VILTATVAATVTAAVTATSTAAVTADPRDSCTTLRRLPDRILDSVVHPSPGRASVPDTRSAA